MDRLLGTMREVGASMERDPLWSGLILAPLEISASNRSPTATFVGRGIRLFAGA